MSKRTNPIDGKTTRRKMLKRSAAAASTALAAPLFIPGEVLGKNGAVAPSERIVMGVIGIGGRGGYDLRTMMTKPDVQVAAVCDVQAGRRMGAKKLVDNQYGNTDCSTYIDFFELLARQDIDAVLIATGDNWHSMASIHAARAGKDIYCEKPMSVAISESRALSDTMKRYSRIFQCGTQRRNVGNFVFAVGLAQSGKLGQLKKVMAEKAWPQSGTYDTILPAQPAPPREEVDFDRWLGPAPWRPFNRRTYARGFWMKHDDFSGGSICEWGSHTVDLCQWANSADHTSPIEYESINAKGDIRAVYENGVVLEIKKGLRFGTCPVRFEGDEGWVETGDSGQLDAHPKSLLEDRRFKGGYPADDHIREFIDCVKTRRQPVSNAEVAHRSITACHAANIAYKLGRKVKWNPKTEQFINDDQANRMVSRTYRQPWQL